MEKELKCTCDDFAKNRTACPVHDKEEYENNLRFFEQARQSFDRNKGGFEVYDTRRDELAKAWSDAIKKSIQNELDEEIKKLKEENALLVKFQEACIPKKDKPFIHANVRELLNFTITDDISFGKFVELLNQCAGKYATTFASGFAEWCRQYYERYAHGWVKNGRLILRSLIKAEEIYTTSQLLDLYKQHLETLK